MVDHVDVDVVDCRLYICLILNVLYITKLQYAIEATKKENEEYEKTIEELRCKNFFQRSI